MYSHIYVLPMSFILIFNIIKFFIIQMAGLLRRQKLPRHFFFMIECFHCFVSRYSVCDIIIYMYMNTVLYFHNVKFANLIIVSTYL